MFQLKRIGPLVGLLALLLVASVGFGAGFGVAQQATPAGATIGLSDRGQDIMGTIGQALGFVERDWVDRRGLDYTKLKDGAIKGLIAALNDPHSAYFPPQQHQDFDQSLQGKLEGIGVSSRRVDAALLVSAVIKDGPAQKAGVRPQDRIVAVDGAAIKDLSDEEAYRRIRGPKGTTVKLTIERPGMSDRLEISITRDVIEQQTVSYEMQPGGYAVLHITEFSRVTTRQFTDTLKDALDQKPRGLVLDLRDNPGGFLDVAVDITSQFLKDGVIVYEVNADGDRDTYKVKPGGIATDLPLVVLVNKNSASASEIVSGALQDNGRAPIVGENTFGKGTVNHVHPLRDGSAVYLSFARWLTPKEKQIEGKGVTPDIEVKADSPLPPDHPPLNAGQNDPVLARGLEYLQGQTTLATAA